MDRLRTAAVIGCPSLATGCGPEGTPRTETGRADEAEGAGERTPWVEYSDEYFTALFPAAKGPKRSAPYRGAGWVRKVESSGRPGFGCSIEVLPTDPFREQLEADIGESLDASIPTQRVAPMAIQRLARTSANRWTRAFRRNTAGSKR